MGRAALFQLVHRILQVFSIGIVHVCPGLHNLGIIVSIRVLFIVLVANAIILLTGKLDDGNSVAAIVAGDLVDKSVYSRFHRGKFGTIHDPLIQVQGFLVA